MRWRLISIALLSFAVAGWTQSRTDRYAQLDSLFEAGAFEACLALESPLQPDMQASDSVSANFLSLFGATHQQLGDYVSAIPYFEREVALRRTLLPISPEGYSDALFNLMYSYAMQGRNAEAFAQGNELLQYDRDQFGIESEKFIQSLTDFADVLVQVDQPQRAADELKKALSSLRPETYPRALVEAKLGYVYTYLGFHRSAEKSFLIALSTLERLRLTSTLEYQLTLANFGNLLVEQGRYDRAEEILATSLTEIEKANWPNKDLLYYAALNNFSLANQMLGQYQEAERSFLQILRTDSAELGTDHPDFAVTLSNIGLLYTDQKKFSDSERVLQQALQILRDQGETNSLSYARKLNNLARNYQQSDQPARAIPLLEEALAIFKTQLGSRSPSYGTALHNLGAAFVPVDNKRAQGYLKKALIARTKALGKRHPLRAETLEKLAISKWKAKNQKEASNAFAEVFQNYFQQVDDFFPVLTEEEKGNLFFNKIRPSIETYASWIASQSQSAAELGRLYNIALTTKGLVFYATDKVRRSILQSGDSTLMTLFDTWEQQKELLAFYYGQNQDPKKIDSLLQESKETEKRLVRLSTVFQKEMVRPQRTWQEVQQKLKSNEAAIEIVRFRKFNPDSARFSNQVTYAFLVLTSNMKDGPQLVTLTNGLQMEGRMLNFYRNNIRLRSEDDFSYKAYWETVHDLLKKLEVKTIYLSPDGVYNSINLQTIKNPFTKQYLLDEFDIRLQTSTRDLVTAGTGMKNGLGSLLLGYPTYGFQNITDSTGRPTQTALVSRSIRGALARFASGNGRQGILPLPGTKKEIEQIVERLKQQHEPTVFLEEQATELTLKKAKSPAVIHIATHGYFLEDRHAKVPNPLLQSGLILAGADNFIKDGLNPLHESEDGILTAFEALNLDLEHTELVVLSACETGLGVVQTGEGVYGLQRAFRMAGAQHLIMSLWPVDDEATQQLMVLVYDHWLRTKNIRDAFWLAQHQLKATYPDAFHWGSFIIVGP